MRHLSLLAALLVTVSALQAQTFKANGARDDIRANRYLAASNYTAYDHQYAHFAHDQTPAPEGYLPFFVSSYARHGSRWLTSTKQYDMPISVLQRADSLHQLTKTGKTLLRELQDLRAASPDEKMGVLTDVGFNQHHQLATRLCADFPTVFDKSASITARSSYVPRCVKSMAEQVETIEWLTHCSMIPQFSGTSDIQAAMANWQTPDDIRAAQRQADSIAYAYTKSHTPMYRLQKSWFRYPGWTSDKCQSEVVRKVFDLACNMQSHTGGPDLFRYFNDEECYQLWRNHNIEWYLKHANAPQVQALIPHKEEALMRDFITDAAEKVANPAFHGATLRFGHDGCILPLMCLMQIQEISVEVHDLDTLDRVWRNYEIIPMAANVQVIFYRADNADDILVKVRVNEREMHLPLEPVNEVYYRWQDVRKCWETKLR